VARSLVFSPNLTNDKYRLPYLFIIPLFSEPLILNGTARFCFYGVQSPECRYYYTVPARGGHSVRVCTADNIRIFPESWREKRTSSLRPRYWILNTRDR